MIKIGELKKKPSWKTIKFRDPNSRMERYFTGYCGRPLERIKQGADFIAEEDYPPIIEGILEYYRYNRGNSVSFEMQCAHTGELYDVSMKGFAEMIPKMVNGVIQGQFTFKKIGPAVNLYLYDGDDL